MRVIGAALIWSYQFNKGDFVVKVGDFVIINNRAYDPVTGLPVENATSNQPADQPEKTTAPTAKQRGLHKSEVYASPLKRSSTLSRRHVKQVAPAAVKPSITPEKRPAIRSNIATIDVRRTATRVQKAPSVQRFAPLPTRETQPIKQHSDRVAEKHPVVHRAESRQPETDTPRHQRSTAKQKFDTQDRLTQSAVVKPTQKSLKPAEILKNEAILEAMNREVATKQPRRQKHARQQSRFKRFMTVGSSSLAIMLLAGYFTYLSMPQLSIRMAAVQSGINAKYPGYSPSGYSLSGPIAFKDGEVSMKFAYAGGEQSYTINQIRSTWDSSAVKEFVSSQSNNVATTVSGGLTVYTYDNNAAWVNGGVFYTLRGDAPLSSDQIAKIATSM